MAIAPLWYRYDTKFNVLKSWQIVRLIMATFFFFIQKKIIWGKIELLNYYLLILNYCDLFACQTNHSNSTDRIVRHLKELNEMYVILRSIHNSCLKENADQSKIVGDKWVHLQELAMRLKSQKGKSFTDKLGEQENRHKYTAVR